MNYMFKDGSFNLEQANFSHDFLHLIDEYKYFIILSCLITILLFYFYRINTDSRNKEKIQKVFSNFAKIFKQQIGPRFTSQSAFTISTLCNGVQLFLNGTCPVILLLLCPPVAIKTGIFLAKAIVEAILKAQGLWTKNREIDSYIVYSKPNSTYKSLYEQLSAAMGKNKIAILADFDKLNEDIAVQFCDLGADVLYNMNQAFLVVVANIPQEEEINHPISPNVYEEW